MNLKRGKNKNIRDLCKGMNEFKNGYQPRINLVKNDKGNLVADSHSILDNCKNNFCQSMCVHRVTDVRQTEICTAGPLLPYPSACEVMMAIENLKRHKSPGTGQILAD
jgi:hypothetical protein